ncbi:MAG: VWA domain-containing protein [Acidobacteria bacterium]|nr:VWA domain-containing protein [Acidobacteriota bacterium]MCI0623015.1 VWA domain-containing protein [Acidobacteriota bacterium]MCI0717477.1 VWA domain-containing protein [Acidobacteriota bacterium]
MKSGNFLALFLLALSLRSTPAEQANAQSPLASPAVTDAAPSKKELVVDVDLVNVVFSVLDKKGKAITDLSQNEVSITEDDATQKITNFTREAGAPVALVVLIDTSNSIRAQFKVEQEAAIDFFHTTVRRRQDKAMLMSFDSTVDILQPFTDDADLLTKAVRRLKIGGGTKMFDAIQLACQEHLKKELGMRRVLVLISDGDDNMSFEVLNSALEAAQRADVAIYATSTNTSGFFGMSAPKNDKVLKRLAEETGGRAFFPGKIDEMAVHFQDISLELRNQYSLAYRSTNRQRDGSFRSIKINTVRKDVKALHRKGYYAPAG